MHLLFFICSCIFYNFWFTICWCQLNTCSVVAATSAGVAFLGRWHCDGNLTHSQEQSYRNAESMRVLDSKADFRMCLTRCLLLYVTLTRWDWHAMNSDLGQLSRLNFWQCFNHSLSMRLKCWPLTPARCYDVDQEMTINSSSQIQYDLATQGSCPKVRLSQGSDLRRLCSWPRSVFDLDSCLKNHSCSRYRRRASLLMDAECQK